MWMPSGSTFFLSRFFKENNMTLAFGKSLLPATVGFDRLFSTMEEYEKLYTNTKIPTYPPYNIVRYDEDNYEIQIAVAGFELGDIDIESHRNKLTVSGKCQKEEGIEYLYHGLSSRDFKHTFTLSDTVIVKAANIKNGVLKISLENIIPEEKKYRKIEIQNETPLLTEDK